MTMRVTGGNRDNLVLELPHSYQALGTGLNVDDVVGLLAADGSGVEAYSVVVASVGDPSAVPLVTVGRLL